MVSRVRHNETPKRMLAQIAQQERTTHTRAWPPRTSAFGVPAAHIAGCQASAKKRNAQAVHWESMEQRQGPSVPRRAAHGARTGPTMTSQQELLAPCAQQAHINPTKGQSMRRHARIAHGERTRVPSALKRRTSAYSVHGANTARRQD